MVIEEDKNAKTTLDEFYSSYTDMCKEWEILNVGNKYKVGQIITHIYSKDLCQYTCPSTGN